MNKIKKFFSGLIKNVWFGIKTCFLASKTYFLLKIIILLSTTAVPMINIWLWKEVINGIIDREEEKLFLALVIYLALKLSVYILEQVNEYVNSRYEDHLQFYIENIMMDKTSRMDLSFFDSAKMGDKVRHARSNFGVMYQLTNFVFAIVSSFINVIAALIIVCTYKWWIGLITVVLLIPYLIYHKKHADKLLEMEKEQLRDNRKQTYYREVFYDNNLQFEIKLHNTGKFFIEKYKNMWNKLYRINRKEEVRSGIMDVVIMMGVILSDLIVLVVSVFDVLAKRIGIGDLQYNLSMVSRLRGEAQSLAY